MDVLSVREASQVSGFSPQHLRRLLREGKILGRLSGGIWLVDEDSLKNYVSQPHPVGRPRQRDNTVY